VVEGLEQVPDINLIGVSAGTEEENVDELVNLFCRRESNNFEVYSDWRLMLKTLKPDIVSIAGPFETRAQMCMEAFRKRIHVFCEKPVATTLHELRKLKTIHDGAYVHFAAMMGLRYEPSFYTAWQAVTDGVVGEIRLINAQKSYKLGSRPMYYHKRETYGGTIPWVGSHAIDLIHWYTGKDFKTVYATHSTGHNTGHGELETTALCHFTLADDVYASVSIDYFRPSNASTHGDDRIRIVGTNGVIEVCQGEVTLTNDQIHDEERLRSRCDRQIFRDFVDHIKGRSECLISAEDTFKVTKACLLARRSADENREINFKQPITKAINPKK
jgi:predicted dehydrogenase